MAVSQGEKLDEEITHLVQDLDPKSLRSRKWSKGEEKLPPKQKCKIFMKYFKMSLLVSVSLLSLVLMARVYPYQHDNHLIAVVPGKAKSYEIRDTKDIDKSVQVILNGPFKPHDKATNDEVQTPVLQVYIEKSGDGGATKQTISGKWDIFLLDADAARKSVGELKSHVFALNERKPGRRNRIYVSLSSANTEAIVTTLIDVNPSPIDQKAGITFGAVILFFLYALIVSEIIDRTLAALVAAGLSLGALAFFDSRPSMDLLVQWIDIETLTLLVGMMILVSIFAESGIFDYLSVFSYRIAKGRTWPLVNCLCFFTAFLAAFLDSVTMMLLVTPVTIRLCEMTALNPVPILMCMVVFANVGAALTPVGDPPNVIITLNAFIKANGVNFGNFCMHMAPGVILALITTYIHVRILYRKPDKLRPRDSKEREQLRHEINIWERAAGAITSASKDEDILLETVLLKVQRLKQQLAEMGDSDKASSFEETLAQLTAQYRIRSKSLLIKSLVVFSFVLILFFLHAVPNIPHLSLGWSALVGALLLIIIADTRDIQAVMEHVEWSTLLFFASLFVVMESLSLLGLIQLLGDWSVNVIKDVEPKHRLTVALMIVLWVSGIASAFLDNIPVTTMMIKIVITLSENESLDLPLHPLVWTLAFGACFGGNGTLIGASANVVTAGVSEQHGYKITFVQFFVVCFPIMLNSLVATSIYLLIAHSAFHWH